MIFHCSPLVRSNHRLASGPADGPVVDARPPARRRFARLSVLAAMTVFALPAPALAIDIDGDGVPEPGDACPNTPSGVPVDAFGRPRADFDLDCDVDMDDFAFFQMSFTGPLDTVAERCDDAVDNDGDGLVDCEDVADCPNAAPCGPNARCSPSQTCACEALFADCNGNPLDGCERSLETITDCNACNTPCSRPNAIASCAGGFCQLTSCNPGFCDLDGIDTNGCEFVLNGNPPCPTLGGTIQIFGDVSSPPTEIPGLAEQWVRVAVTEKNPANVSVRLRISLQSAPGANYDLFVRCTSCGASPIGSSTNGPGQLDEVTVSRPDTPLIDTILLVIEVRYLSGGCDDGYTLTLQGDVSGANPVVCP